MCKKEQKKSRGVGVILLVMAATIIMAPVLTLAGNLEPTAPPGPTMKTLDEVEPRTPIKASDLPKTISESGSYYLAENVPAASGGITIAASNVTLDLSGFSLSGTTGAGIYVSISVSNLTIQNGTITGWLGYGINALNATGSKFQYLNISTAPGSVGIKVGNHCLIERCQVANAETGIDGGTHCTVLNTTVRDIDGDVAYFLGSNARLENCVSHNSYLEAINVGDDSELFNCIAEGTTTAGGFNLRANCKAEGCVARGNNGYGFILSSGGSLINCTSIDNTGDGIRITGAGNRLENNTVKGNGTNYDIADGNNVHEIPSAWSQTFSPASERFVLVLNNEAVLDKETGLVWARRPYINAVNWTDANYYCYRLEIANRKGWRLPTVDELASLIDTSQTDPALPPDYEDFFDFDFASGSTFWSSTTFIGTSSDTSWSAAWSVHLYDGNVDGYGKQIDYHVIAVRGGQ